MPLTENNDDGSSQRRHDSASWQNRVSDLQGMERRMEVYLITKVRRFKRLCSPPPWQSYIPS